MSEKSRMLRKGARMGVLGSPSDLCIAAPLAEDNYDPAAHTDASRIGFYFDRTASSERLGAVIMGTDILRLYAGGLHIPGYMRPGYTTDVTEGNIRFNQIGDDDIEAFVRNKWRSLTKPGAAGPGGDLEVFNIGEGGPYSEDAEGTEIVEYWLYDASATSGSRFTRASVNAGTMLTGDGDALIIGSRYVWSAWVLNITAAAVLGGSEFVVEYWDGAAWVETTIATYTVNNNDVLVHLADQPFQAIELEAVEHADGIETDWDAADDVTDEIPAWDLSENKYALRVRNNGTITTGASFDDGQVRGTDLSISPITGDASLWGRSRGSGSVTREAGRFTSPPASIAPASADITLGATSTLRGNINSFPGNKLAELLFVTVIPEWVDTATPMRFRWTGSVSTDEAGNLELEAVLVPYVDGDIADGTIPEYGPDVEILAAPGTANEIQTAEIPIDISFLSPSTQIAVRFYRDASGGNGDDTYAGAWTMLDIELVFSRKLL